MSQSHQLHRNCSSKFDDPKTGVFTGNLGSFKDHLVVKKTMEHDFFHVFHIILPFNQSIDLSIWASKLAQSCSSLQRFLASARYRKPSSRLRISPMRGPKLIGNPTTKNVDLAIKNDACAPNKWILTTKIGVDIGFVIRFCWFATTTTAGLMVATSTIESFKTHIFQGASCRYCWVSAWETCWTTVRSPCFFHRSVTQWLGQSPPGIDLLYHIRPYVWPYFVEIQSRTDACLVFAEFRSSAEILWFHRSQTVSDLFLVLLMGHSWWSAVVAPQARPHRFVSTNYRGNWETFWSPCSDPLYIDSTLW